MLYLIDIVIAGLVMLVLNYFAYGVLSDHSSLIGLSTGAGIGGFVYAYLLHKVRLKQGL